MSRGRSESKPGSKTGSNSFTFISVFLLRWAQAESKIFIYSRIKNANLLFEKKSVLLSFKNEFERYFIFIFLIGHENKHAKQLYYRHITRIPCFAKNLSEICCKTKRIYKNILKHNSQNFLYNPIANIIKLIRYLILHK